MESSSNNIELEKKIERFRISSKIMLIPAIILGLIGLVYLPIKNCESNKYLMKKQYSSHNNLCPECMDYYKNRAISERKTVYLEKENIDFGKFPENPVLETKCNQIVKNHKDSVRRSDFNNYYSDANPYLFLIPGF